jgi:hypothetical protein
MVWFFFLSFLALSLVGLILTLVVPFVIWNLIVLDPVYFLLFLAALMIT